MHNTITLTNAFETYIIFFVFEHSLFMKNSRKHYNPAIFLFSFFLFFSFLFLFFFFTSFFSFFGYPLDTKNPIQKNPCGRSLSQRLDIVDAGAWLCQARACTVTWCGPYKALLSVSREDSPYKEDWDSVLSFLNRERDSLLFQSIIYLLLFIYLIFFFFFFF